MSAARVVRESEIGENGSHQRVRGSMSLGPTTLLLAVAACSVPAGLLARPSDTPRPAAGIPVAPYPKGQIADTLRLPELQARAVRHDPRSAQDSLENMASGLRTRDIEAARRPSLSLRGEGAVVSEVTDFDLGGPGAAAPTVPQDRQEAALDLVWRLWDGGRTGAELGVETSRRVRAEVQLERDLFLLRGEVNAAFFAAVLTQSRRSELELLKQDLEARLTEAVGRVAAGAALPADTARLRAELLVLGQGSDGAAAELRGALDILESLTAQRIPDDVVLIVPVLESHMEALLASPRRHPQYRVFDAERDRLEAEDRVAALRSRPMADLFATAAFGRPGLNQFRDDIHGYGQAGVRVTWSPWNWGTTKRAVELVEVRRRVLETEEASFTARLQRATSPPLRRIAALRSAIATDERIVELRALVERQALARLDERAIPVSWWIESRTDLQQARLDRLRHHAELAQAQAEYLTTLGVEIP